MIKEFGRFADGPIAQSRLYGVYNNYLNVNHDKHLGMSGYKAFVGTLMTLLIGGDSVPLRYLSSDYTEIPYMGLILDYSRTTVSMMRDYTTPDTKKELKVYFDRLKDVLWFIEHIDNCKNTKEVMNLVDKEIVPHIRDLLEQQTKKDKAMGEMASALHGKMKELKEKLEAAKKSFAEKGFKGEGSILDDLITGSKEGEKYRTAEIPTDNELDRLYRIHIHALTSHFRSILEERTTVKYAGAYKRGKLLPRNVYKAKTDEKRMYSKRKHFDTPFYEVSFLIDESGSMQGGSRYEDVYAAGFIINKAAQRLKFKINYISWDDEVSIHKEYNQMRDCAGGGNNEDQVLKKIAKIINYDNEQIIFLLTDGGVDSYNSPRPMLNKFKKQGVHVIPIGINIPQSQEQEFKKWYPESVLVKDIDSLVKAMATFMKKIIHR